MNNNKCIYCGSLNTDLIEEILSPLNNKQYRLYHCNSCLIQFILPNVFEDVYSEGVSKNSSMDDYVTALHSGRTFIEPPTKQVINELRKLKVNLANRKVLDIGAGDGINYLALQEICNLSPDNYYAVECDPNSIEICRKRGLSNIFNKYFSTKNLDKLPSGFDIVIFTEVLEHQTDPQDFMQAVKRVTKPGGLILFTVPNRKMFKISRAVFYADLPPHHFLRFDKQFFLRNLCDFKKLKVAVYTNPFMILNKDRACGKVSRALFKTDKLKMIISPIFGLLYSLWEMLLHFKGNGIIVVLRK